MLVSPALAEPAPSARPGASADRYDFSVHGETHLELFRRALLPGPAGSLVRTETLAPVNQYIRLRARDLDLFSRTDSLDLELAVWGNAALGAGDSEALLDGDVQTAYVGYRHGPLSFRLGRQHAAGGAARYSRFDGLSVGARLAEGLDALAYAGLGVLPRWHERPSYQYLGTAADSELRAAEAVPEPDRIEHWLGGGRLAFVTSRAQAGLSFHEQREAGELSRRNLGADARAYVSSRVSGAGSLILDLDSESVADARLWVDFAPARVLDLSVEGLHVEPALLLSRQSVLSVFSAEGYDEIGALATARLAEQITLEGGSWLTSYDADRFGSRSEATARLLPDRGRTLLRLTYARVLAPSNGYHSLRAALSRRLLRGLWSSLEAYGYFYDEAIRGARTSSVYAGTLSVRPSKAFSALWGASLARSPYARLDAQTQVRLSYDFDLSNGAEPR